MNATLIQQKFHIQASKKADATALLRNWARLYCLMSKAGRLIDEASSFHVIDLESMLQVLGYDDQVNDDGDIVYLAQRDCDAVTEDHAGAFSALRRVVTPGSFLVFHTDADTLMRWRWGTDELFHVEQGGAILFGERDSLLVEIRATLQIARQESKDKAFRGRIDQLLKELRNSGASEEVSK